MTQGYPVRELKKFPNIAEISWNFVQYGKVGPYVNKQKTSINVRIFQNRGHCEKKEKTVPRNWLKILEIWKRHGIFR